MSRDVFMEKFKTPEVARPYLSVLFTEQEMDFVEKIDKETFTAEEVDALVGEPAADRYYRRAIIAYTDDSRSQFKLGDFYGRLDVMCLGEQAAYRSIPKEGQRALDAWYLKAYQDKLDPDLTKRPTDDVITTLEETLAFIDSQGDKNVYLADCDCKSLTGDCGLPRRTCITYRDGINTTVDRGLAEKIDAEKAKEVIRMADDAGLMHTVNATGICNCCGDCCYLFRTMEQRHSTGLWPKSNYLIAWEEDACVQCGACLERCHFTALSMEDGIVIDKAKCVGCGICASVCPTEALHLVDR